MKADTSTILYIIIALIAILGGSVEKYIKAKKQEEMKRRQPSPDDAKEPGTVENESEEVPKTMEEVLRRWVTQHEEAEATEETFETEEAKSYETDIPYEGPPTSVLENLKYTDVRASILSEEERALYAVAPVETETGESANANANVVFGESYHFDIRQAIIASEILNRKYQ
jgi:hypothetical protein